MWAMALAEHFTNELTQRVIGAAIEVHRHLGPGLLESCYQVCLSHELSLRNIKHLNNVTVPLRYKTISHAHAYVADIVVDDLLVLELKSVEELKPLHTNQLFTYMRLLKVPAGLIINFNSQILAKGMRRKLL